MTEQRAGIVEELEEADRTRSHPRTLSCTRSPARSSPLGWSDRGLAVGEPGERRSRKRRVGKWKCRWSGRGEEVCRAVGGGVKMNPTRREKLQTFKHTVTEKQGGRHGTTCSPEQEALASEATPTQLSRAILIFTPLPRCGAAPTPLSPFSFFCQGKFHIQMRY